MHGRIILMWLSTLRLVVFVVRYTERYNTGNSPQFQPTNAYNCHLIQNNEYDCELNDGCVHLLV